MSEHGNATDAQDFNPPFRVDKTGLARREEWRELSQDESYVQELDAQVAAAGTAGPALVASQVEVIS
jgi:hypothetical protein